MVAAESLPLMRRHILFYSLIAIAVALRLGFVMLLPLGQTVSHRLEGLNDEASHVTYVDFLREQKRFPVQKHHAREPDSFTRNEFEYYQAPLYYIVGTVAESLAGKESRVIACRFVSFVFGLLTLLIIWKICSSLSITAAARQATVCFAAFLPTHAYFSSVVSNDSLCWLMSAIVLLILTRQSLASGPTWHPVKTGIVLGLLLGIGMLVKASVVVFIPVIVVFVALRYHETRNRAWVFAGILTLCVCAVVAGPWYLRNVHLYGSVFAENIGNGPHQFFLFRPHEFFVFLYSGLFSFWFPMQQVPASHSAGWLFRVEMVYTTVGALLCCMYYFKKNRFRRAEILLAAALFFTGLAYVKYNLFWSNSDGRFLLTALAPIAVFFCVPLTAVFGRLRMDYAGVLASSACALFPYSFLMLVK